ncbi:unnamed protein product [Phytophthora lilii]|uniref:Unnamed protein product n=1 Tax=Phytophthora lilii TaxID=2077276 RepID=A0A9W6YI35_9STRA|nr:unnamed protein product [Phytophthora lilii]
MGAAVSSLNANTHVAISASPTVQGPALRRLRLATHCEFHLDANKLSALFPSIAQNSVEKGFAILDPDNGGVVDSCELCATLILLAPQLSRETKQKGICCRLYSSQERWISHHCAFIAIFELFNVSTHRVGLLVADEATLLFRTVAIGAAKALRSIAATISPDKAAEELPKLAYFEDLTKALYGEHETLAYEDFARLCLATPEIDAFMAQWTSDSRQGT